MKWTNATFTIALFSLFICSCGASAADTVIDFEDWVLESESRWIGPVSEDEGFERPGLFGGRERVGFIHSGGLQLVNRNNLLFGNWSGFAISNQTDTATPGAGNQTSAFAGGGAGPDDDNYAVAYGYIDDLDPSQTEQLDELPFIELPAGGRPSSMLVTNTTYAALSMLHGDQFAKKFGGEGGDDPDFFRLSVYGVDEQGLLLPRVVETYLADYRFEDRTEDYLVDTWISLDLEPLSSARRLYFNLDSSDANPSGMVTPAYFAVDQIVLETALLGDFDADGEVNASDANLICMAIADSAGDSQFDLDGDRQISTSDLTVFLSIANTTWGDFNLDGQVAFDDFLRLSGRYGQAGTWEQGDSNCNGRVEFSDFLQLSGNFGVSHSRLQTVPEPFWPAAGLVAFALCLVRHGRLLS